MTLPSGSFSLNSSIIEPSFLRVSRAYYFPPLSHMYTEQANITEPIFYPWILTPIMSTSLAIYYDSSFSATINAALILSPPSLQVRGTL
jgi:hypothetical protein